MSERAWLTERFEEHRHHLRGVAYRMLGSLTDADDAVQEAWLRLNRADTSDVENLGGWLTTVVARVCLDMLRSRKSRREEPIDLETREPAATNGEGADPEREALLADAVGLALLVVLDTLAPAERLAFVLHDLFAMPFAEIGPIVGRSPAAARQLASRARRRVRGAPVPDEAERARQRDVVGAFLAALRAGDFEGLLAVLDPDVVVRIDAAAAATGTDVEIRGAAAWATGAIAFWRTLRGRPSVQPALVNGSPGLILAPRGRLSRAMRFTFSGDKIAQVDVVADPARLRALDLAVVED